MLGVYQVFVFPRAHGEQRFTRPLALTHIGQLQQGPPQSAQL